MKASIIELVGWYGVVGTLAAYVFVSFGILPPDSLIYQLLNFTGATGLVIISFVKKAWQPMTLDAIWALIALVALGRILVGP